ncbi:MAG TPA: PH domain-containing protein [Candidatus Binatia bacterium]|nr:PH domain-containing protein [Candidatus Binatia bacterium]
MSRYAESLLADGERIVLEVRQHPVALLYRARWAIAALVGALVLVFLASGLPTDGVGGGLRNLLGLAALVLVVVGVAAAGWAYLQWAADEDVLTNRRVIQIRGVVNKEVADSSLEKINDAEMTQSWLGRLLNFGDLDVMTASEAGIERMRTMPDPKGFKRAMLNAKHEYELELARGGVGGPPLRPAAAVPMPPPGSPSGVASPSAAGPGAGTGGRPSASTPEEVTRTLAQLAELRDRGAISPEDYERKKQELLDRL